MSAHLDVLREGQLFYFHTEVMGWRDSHDRYIIAPTPKTGNLPRIFTTSSQLRVFAVWWSYDGLAVDAIISGEQTAHFTQRVRLDLWKKHKKSGAKMSPDVTEVCRVSWPKPSSTSLVWAVRGLLNEKKQDLGSRFKPELTAIQHCPFNRGIVKAMKLLREADVSNSGRALRERGFSVSDDF